MKGFEEPIRFVGSSPDLEDFTIKVVDGMPNLPLASSILLKRSPRPEQ